MSNEITQEQLEWFIIENSLVKSGYDDEVCSGCGADAHYMDDTDRLEVSYHDEDCLVAKLCDKHFHRIYAEREDRKQFVIAQKLEQAAQRKIDEENRWNAMTPEQQKTYLENMELINKFQGTILEKIAFIASLMKEDIEPNMNKPCGLAAWLNYGVKND